MIILILAFCPGGHFNSLQLPLDHLDEIEK